MRLIVPGGTTLCRPGDRGNPHIAAVAMFETDELRDLTRRGQINGTLRKPVTAAALSRHLELVTRHLLSRL